MFHVKHCFAEKSLIYTCFGQEQGINPSFQVWMFHVKHQNSGFFLGVPDALGYSLAVGLFLISTS